MKTIAGFVVLSLLTVVPGVRAQEVSTNSIGSAEAVRIVSQFRVGTPEQELSTALEAQHGLKLTGGVGGNFGWTRGCVLPGGGRLLFRMRPRELYGAPDWMSGTNGLLVSACIESNGVKLPISLGKALQP